MNIFSFKLSFLTPAFLGDAEQNGRWRTPPFKAQLRQWWRVVYAADRGFNPNLTHMHDEEGRLFGNAWLEDNYCKSKVRLRLNRWDEGRLKKTQWPQDSALHHPEVKKEGRLVPVGGALYLGYGPLEFNKFSKGTALKKNAAIQAMESATLSLAVPAAHAARLERALMLMHRFGTVGGRSRNGWGSYALEPEKGTSLPEGPLPLRPWQDCLALDWPHAIGTDGKGPLIWQTEALKDWPGVMKRLAELKIGLRTQFGFTTGKQAPAPEDRHWLSYPVTHHSVRDWDNARLPNSLRFKIRKTEKGLVGVIFHMPHCPPPAFRPNRTAIEQVWGKVHAFLDNQKLMRIKE